MVAGALFTVAAVHGQAVYSVADLNTLGGASAIPWGVNAAGTVVGVSGRSDHLNHPFRWTPTGGMEDLGTLGGPSGLANHVTDGGVVVGWARNAGNIDNAFRWDIAGGMLPIPGMDPNTPSYAFSANDAGLVVGSLFTPTGLERAFMFDPVAGVSDPFPTNPYACGMRAVNATGQIAGFLTFAATGSPQGFFRPVMGSISLFGNQAWGINSLGQVVGNGSGGAFLWTPPNSYVILPPTFLQTVRAYAVSSYGVVVGYGTTTSGRRHAFIFSDGIGLVDLNALVPTSLGLEIGEAHDVNSAGQIAAAALDVNGNSHALLLSPPPMPAVLYVKAGAPAGGDGTSWGSAYRSLQDALTTAALAGGAVHEIWVAAGVYVPSWQTVENNRRSATFQLVRDVAVYGGFAGTEVSREERDWLLHPTVLSGDLNADDGPNFVNNSENAYHVVTATLRPDPATATLDGFTIRGGNADSSSSAQSGAGVLCEFGSAVLSHLAIVGNSASSVAGMVSASSSNLISDCTFQGNRAFEGVGAMSAAYHTVVRRCAFLDNHVVGTGSGPGAVLATGNVILSDCLLAGNSAAASGSGGAIQIETPAVLINSRIVGNSAGSFGGGVNGGGATIINCLINGNTARWGGGISGNARVLSSTIAHNRALDTGGGLYNSSNSPATISNCVVWGNTGPGIPGELFEFAGPTSPVVNYTCSQYWTGLLGGAGNFGLPPQFISENGPDGVPGTLDDDLHLNPASSPCIDSGSNALIPPDSTDLDGDGNTTEPLPLDLDRNLRATDDPMVPDTGEGSPPIVDRGCYEAPPPPCYPNCDGSTAPPILNVNDFVCFANRFAAGDSYANCDHSTTPPILNVNDFVCFQNAFVSGCP